MLQGGQMHRIVALMACHAAQVRVNGELFWYQQSLHATYLLPEVSAAQLLTL